MLRGWSSTRLIDVGIEGVAAACVGEYDGWLRELILTHKERSAWSLATPLGGLLAHAVRALGDGSPVVLVAVPSRRGTVRRRGHDPALRMTRAAATALRGQGIQAYARPLLRVRLPVRDSVGLTAAQRRLNLVDAFAAARGASREVARLGAARIIVCDDVTTTGTTLREACAALSLAGIPASGAATIAVVGRPAPDLQALHR